MNLLCCLTLQIQSSLYGKKRCMMLNGRFYAMQAPRVCMPRDLGATWWIKTCKPKVCTISCISYAEKPGTGKNENHGADFAD